MIANTANMTVQNIHLWHIHIEENGGGTEQQRNTPKLNNFRNIE
jgi:hypothetical protein